MQITTLTVVEVVIAIAFWVALLTINFRLAGVQSRMIAKLNAANPPDHQYDQWGHPLFGSRWISAPFRGERIVREYRAKFGEDDLFRQRKRLFFSGMIVVPLGFIFLCIWLF